MANDRQELLDLRRLAELEAKAGIAPEIPSPDFLSPEAAAQRRSDFLPQLGREAGLLTRAATKGFAAIPTAIGNIPAATANLVSGTYNTIAEKTGLKDKYGIGNAKKIAYVNPVSEGFDAMGITPQTPGERIQEDVVAALSGTGSLVKAAQTAPEVVGPKLSQIFSQRPDLQLRAAGGSSLASGTTREMGGGPVAQFLAGVAGGGLASMTKSPKLEYLNSDDVKKMAGAAYKSADEQGGVLAPEFTNKFLDKADEVVPQTTAGKMLSGDSPVSQIVERIKGLKNKTLTLAEAQEIDEYLSTQIDSFVDKATGVVDKQGKKIQDIQMSFRGLIDNAAEGDIIGSKGGFEALKEGRQLWSRAAKLRDVEKILTRAEFSDNPVTTIRAGFRTILSNPNRLRGYSKEEIKAMKEAARLGIGTGIAKIFGSSLGPIISASTGGGFGGTATSLAGSLASKGLATSMQVKKVQNLAQMIAGQKALQQPAETLIPRAIGTTQGIFQ